MGRQYVYESSASSSDSDSELPPPRRYRRRQHRSRKHAQSHGPSYGPHTAVPALQGVANGTPDDDNKEKKKKPVKPPQESIDQIWEKFSQKKFSKALAVLPFAPVQASTSGERGNELLVAGYERAAEECRRKVRKIISECRRVNTRYRDPGWDLDWDFKWEKGHCLNSLGKTKFDLCHSNLVNPAASIPKGVKRVHEIFEDPKFMGSLLPGDIKQGSLGNCWFVASLTGLANVEDGIKRICVEYDTKIGIYGFVFYRDGEWIYSIVDDKLYLKSPNWDSPSMQRDLLQQIDRDDVERVYRKTYQAGSKALFFAQNKDQNETWVPLLEKAYAKAHGDFASLAGGWIGEALEDLSGGVTTELLASDIFDVDAFWDNELSKVNQEFLFGCSTGLLERGYGDRDGITEGHAYVVMDARTLKNGTRLCKLRNPWGKIKKGNWEGAWSDGSKEWTTEVQEELDHTFGSDSTFWIAYEDLMRKYQHFDRTRLFRDPDWRSCQRWIGAEVAWKPQYHEKFNIKLTKDSPLVLVLSQLDNRYFRGLQGQYNFRLQFRVHEEGRPGAEEYIVRSHGNYIMDRSVSVELPSLGAGSYSVFISITGERDTRMDSTEDVIRRECKGREENEKLAQVGQAYDLAHSKAASHLARLAKVRRKAEARKASELRCKERKQNWQKRRTLRMTNRKQREKDEGKKAREKAAKKVKADAKVREAADKTAAEEQPKTQAEPHAVVNSVRTEVKEHSVDNASTTSTSFSSTGSPQYTPKSEPACPLEDHKQAITVPPVETHQTPAVPGGPPVPQPLQSAHACAAALFGFQTPLELKLHYCSCSTCKPPPQPEESDDYSSDSPVEDYERLYDEDDVTPTLRLAGAPGPAGGSNGAQDSDDSDVPDPWNAIAVIGFRVYSKDEHLELRVVMEGGELEQDGMGNLGEADLDNAVSNAAGQREKKQEEENKKLEGGDQSVEDAAEGPRRDPQIPEVSITDPSGANDTEKSAGQLEGSDKGFVSAIATATGKAPYRTIIERNTSEYDRVMGKTVNGEQPASTEDTKTAPADRATSGEVKQEPPHTVDVSTATTPATCEAGEGACPDRKFPSEAIKPTEIRSPRPPTASPGEKTFREVLYLRYKLQRGLFRPTAATAVAATAEQVVPTAQPHLPEEQHMREMSDLVARLEAIPEVEVTADVIRRTRIYQVLRMILKQRRWERSSVPSTGPGLGEEDEFGIGERLLALADDYELTLVTAEMEKREKGEGLREGVRTADAQGREERKEYFDQTHAGEMQ